MSRPGVGLVEHRDLRLEHRHLQDLGALLLAAGEAVVEVARGERAVDVEQLDRVRSSSPNSLTWIGSSRLALIAMRRKFATDTPGIATGYWKARKRPALRALVRLRPR